MNRVITKATKLVKKLGTANFFTKLNIPMSLRINPQTSQLSNISKMYFAENERNTERRFERFSDSSSIRQGKHNIRINLATERLPVIIEYIEKNAQNFNDGDYFESLNLVAQKIEQEYRFGLRRPGLKILNDFVVENFQKYSGSMGITFLHYLSSLAAKDTRIISKDLSKAFLEKNIQHLEKNQSTLSLYQILNTASMIGLIGNYNPSLLIREREGELSSISFGQIMRIAKRLTFVNQSNSCRAVISRFIVNDLLNKATNERILNKTRILNVLCKIDSLDPLSNLFIKIRSLLKSIRDEFDQLDTTSILQISEAMIYFEDFSKSEILKDMNDLVLMTLNHNPDSVYPDFFVRYLEHFSKMKSDTGLTQDHLKSFLEFYLQNKKQDEIKNTKSLMPIFTVMKKCRFYQKDILEQFFDLTLNTVQLNNIDDNLFAYRFMITNHLGEEHFKKAQEIVKNECLKNLNDESKKENIFNIFNNFAKLCFFNCDEEVIESSFKIVKQCLINNDMKNFVKLIEIYLENVQEHIKPHFRDILVEELLKKVDFKIDIIQYNKLYIYLNELMISRENEELKKKIFALTSSVSENTSFKNGLVRSFENETNLNNRFIAITNMSFSKYLFLLRELIKDPEFIVNKEKNIILNILQTTFNLIKINKYDQRVSDDLLSSFLRVGNDIVTKYPNVLPSININRLSNYLRAFNGEDLESPLLEKLSFATLNSLTDQRLERDLSNDIILLLEKLCKNERNPEKFELINKILGSENKIKRELENSFLFSSIYKLLANLNKIDNTVLVKDELLIWGKDLLINKLKDENLNLNSKLNTLYALSNARTNIISENDITNMAADIKSIFLGISIRKLIKTLNNAPGNVNRGTLSRKLHLEYSNLFEKDETPNKFLSLKTLDRFTTIKWPFMGIYNKFMADYDKLFDKFTPSEHANIINYFSRVNINREDVVSAAAKAISINALPENEKITLFKSIVKLGFYRPEKKLDLIENLLNKIDHTHVLRKQPTIAKLTLLFNAWKLDTYSYDVKSYINVILENLTKTNVDRFETRKRYQFDNVNYQLLNSELAKNLDDLTKKNLLDTFHARKNSLNSKFPYKVIVNYLNVMNNTIEEFPESNFSDIYIPEE